MSRAGVSTISAVAVCATCGMPVRTVFDPSGEIVRVFAVCGHVKTPEAVPKCKGQAVCTNGRKCLDAGVCLRPYQCEYCGRSSDLPGVCAGCGEEG